MERSPYTPMTPSNEGTNPLRPYYRPPSIGAGARDNFDTQPLSAAGNRSSQSLGSSTRGYLADLNNEILGSSGPSTMESARALLDQAIWKYTSVFLAQPFDVAKMVLQVRYAGADTLAVTASSDVRRSSRQATAGRDHDYPSEEDEDDDDEPAYFTSAAPQPYPLSPSSNSGRGRRTPSRQQSNTPARPPQPSYKLELKRPDSLMEALGQLWQREGAWGAWKGTNVTFLYSLILKTIESWTRGMLAAVFNLPDPGVVVSSGGVGGLDILDSPSPLSSLGVAVAAAGIAGLLLAPLDAARTRIMLTPVTHPPRSTVPALRSLPSWLCPSQLITPTILHSCIPTLISTSTPLFLRSNLRIDPFITPASYSVCTFLSSVTELFIRLPIETVLRRGQVQFMAQPAAASKVSSQQSSGRSKAKPQDAQPLPTVVDVGPYTGVMSTMWHIVRDEGESYDKTIAAAKASNSASAHRPAHKIRKGQGVQGLWRGWRVGLWGLVGVWGAAALGSGGGGKGGEF